MNIILKRLPRKSAFKTLPDIEDGVSLAGKFRKEVNMKNSIFDAGKFRKEVNIDFWHAFEYVSVLEGKN